MNNPKLPAHMRCIEFSDPGGPEKLVLRERPLPDLGSGEVLIAVHAAGVNRPDIIQRMGNYPPPPGASDLLGLEVSGTIIAVADGITTLAVGDTVCALISGGGYAQYVTAPAVTCLPIPSTLTMIEAAAIPETFFTVWHNVFERGALKAGEVFLVHGGSSGIGTAAIQLAKSFGSTVVATAGNDQKCEACQSLGADLVINYKNYDFAEEIRTKIPDKGVDVILDMVGRPYMSRNIRCLKTDGRLVNIAFLEGSKAEIDFMPIMLKRLILTGSTLRLRDPSFKEAIAEALKSHVWPLIEDNLIRPVVDSIFPLERAADAHRLMESNQHIGKIVLKIS
ncbi:MAG: NAD(P)H-quinone oxidoreductase [Candidatus Marinimicrobia bacterium]|nr:NAD(P)H-quinone oxidoreductase [Candidatus Neomarinimicrobiota bacterium]